MKTPTAVLVWLACAAALTAAPRHLGRYAVVLEDQPVAAKIRTRAELDSPAAREAGERIRARQAAVRKELEARGFRVTGSVETLVNAVFVEANPSDVARLRGIEGVRRLQFLPPAKRHLDEVARLVNAPGAWSVLGGMQNAGAGVKIGILDTGIDQRHPALTDASLSMPAGYPRGPEADRAYTSSKVIAARSYVRMIAEGWTQNPAETSRPDDLSARDRVGHGTAVAVIVAGKQTAAPGGTITGIAPRAYVGNYKVFGSPGVNDYSPSDVIVKAIEDAFNDGMDIVTLSLGVQSMYGPLDTGGSAGCADDPNRWCDIRIQVVENAIARGMTVVISAGNDGDAGSAPPALNTIAAPGTAPSAITVGASRNAHVWFASVRVTGDNVPSDLREIPGSFGDGPRPGGAMQPFPLRDVAKIDNNGRACAALPPGSLGESIALIERGDCFFSVKVNNAQAAGARGVIVYMNDGQETPFSPVGLLQTSIPAVMIGNTNGKALKNFVNTYLGQPVVLDPTLKARPDSAPDTLAAFSSRGPSIGEYGIKPDLVAPGTSVYTATQTYDPNGDMFDATGYTSVSGTSFSAPVVAGVAALVKQRNPSFTPLQIKSAIVNTATPISGDTGSLRVLGIGAGRLDAVAAVNAKVTAEPATISLGALNNATFPKRTTMTVRTTLSGVTLRARIVPENPKLRLSQSGTGPIEITLDGPAPSPGVYTGNIEIYNEANTNEVYARVPYMYLVGDQIPYATVPITGDGFDAITREVINCPYYPSLAFKLVDQYGVPVDTSAGTVVWRAISGGGELECETVQGQRRCYVDGETDRYGIAAACVIPGAQIGEQQFQAEVNASGVKKTIDYFGTARIRPAIGANGVVDAASNTVGPRGLAPGSYAAIYGVALSDTSRLFSTPYLPVSLSGVSISFDIPAAGLSIPARLHFISPGQVNIQVPWELEGYNEVLMKVSIGDHSSALYTLPLTDTAPQIYQYASNHKYAGFAIVQRANTVTYLTPDNPINKGEWITLYANGLGRVTNRPQTGEATSTTAVPEAVVKPVITIGDKVVPPGDVWAGMSPASIGLYQINVRVPNDVGGGQQQLTVNQNGVLAKAVSLPIKQ